MSLSVSHLLTLRCEIQKDADSKTATGGPLRTPATTLHADVPCATKQLSGDASELYGRKASTEIRRFYFDTDWGFDAATAKKRIVFGGKTYAVVASNNVNGLGRLWQVDAERLSL